MYRPIRTLSVVVVGGWVLTACDSEATDVGDDPPSDPTLTHDYRVVELVDGLDHPWGLVFLSEDEVLVTERPGRVRWVQGWELQEDPVGGPAVEAGGQGGLLDIELHPDFPAVDWVYMSYSKAVDDGVTTAVARARWQDEELTDLEDVFVADAAASTGAHFGSRVTFDEDGLLYVTVGDRGQASLAQDPSNHIGTTLRLHADGSVPSGNPFVGDPDARDEIFTYGNRNAQGQAIHPGTGEVWQNEHGPQGGDELNRMVGGGNYGWPEYNYGEHYDGRPIPDPHDDSGTVLPVTHWTPAIAPSGLTFYTGDPFPHWQGSAFNGALVARHIRRVVLDGMEVLEEERLLDDYGERIREVVEGPDGYLYFLTDSSNGILGRLEPDG